MNDYLKGKKMELEYKGNEIIFSKELSNLDNFVLDFVGILLRNKIKHVIISGYVAILFGRNRMSEDVDFLIQHITYEQFQRFWSELERSYECLNTGNPHEAYYSYLENHTAIRIAQKGSYIPNIELKFVKNELDRFSLNNRKQVKLGEKILFISPLELQIPYKLFLGSEKDIEDSRFLFKLFRDKLNMGLLDSFLTEMNISKESANKYLGAEL